MSQRLREPAIAIDPPLFNLPSTAKLSCRYTRGEPVGPPRVTHTVSHRSPCVDGNHGQKEVEMACRINIKMDYGSRPKTHQESAAETDFRNQKVRKNEKRRYKLTSPPEEDQRVSP